MDNKAQFTIRAGIDEISFFVDEATELDGVGGGIGGGVDFSVGDRYRVDLVQCADGTWLAQKASALPVGHCS